MNNAKLIIILAFIAPLAVSCSRDDDDERNKFTGRYEVREQSLETFAVREDYQVRIRKDMDTEDGLIISNFYNFDVDVSASVEGNELYIFPQQHNIFEFEGQGVLSGSIISLEYTVRSLPGESYFFDRLEAEMTLKE